MQQRGPKRRVTYTNRDRRGNAGLQHRGPKRRVQVTTCLTQRSERNYTTTQRGAHMMTTLLGGVGQKARLTNSGRLTA